MTAQNPNLPADGEKMLPRPPATLPNQSEDNQRMSQAKSGGPKEPLDLPREALELPNPPTQTAGDVSETKPETKEQKHTHHQHAIETLLEWTAPGRPFRKRDRQYYLTSILLVLLIEIILFLFSQHMLMLLILSFLFVAFALSSVAPGNFKYRISTEGITIEDHFFLWQELYDFYFKKREGVEVIHIRTHSFIPGELTLTLGTTDREHIKSILLPYLPYREFIKPTFMEKSGDWLGKNFPLEKESR